MQACSSAKAEIVISSGDEEVQHPQQQLTTQGAVYVLTSEENEQQMEVMLCYSVLHVNGPATPPEILLHAKPEPASHSHSRQHNRGVLAPGHVKEERLSLPP